MLKKGRVIINVTSFSSISYYSNVRLISKIELEQNLQSIKLDVHASANKHPPHLFCFKLRSTNKYKGYPIFQIEIHKPCPDLNGGKHIRRVRGLVSSNRYINEVTHLTVGSMGGSNLPEPDLLDVEWPCQSNS